MKGAFLIAVAIAAAAYICYRTVWTPPEEETATPQEAGNEELPETSEKEDSLNDKDSNGQQQKQDR